MCFYNDDYDWYANVCEVSMVTLTERKQCCECSEWIEAGQQCERVWQQENECCSVCEEGGEDWDEDDPQDPDSCDHNYGETFEGYTCETCLKIIKGIEEFEKEEGCPVNARRPSYCGLYEEAFSNWNDDSWKYAEKCVSMFPELVNNMWIADAIEKHKEEE